MTGSLHIVAESAENAYIELLKHACSSEKKFTSSRVDSVRDLGPSIIEIAPGASRLIGLKKRGFNPLFAFVEASWFLDGSNSLSSLTSVLSHFKEFSDDGMSLHGAYGYRMKHAFSTDQLEGVIKELTKYPTSRRAMIGLWNPMDLGLKSGDIPCNTHVYFKVRDDALDMTVCNRSNDSWWGIPYNIFMFYSLQVIIANRLGLREGWQRHFSDSMHLYKRDLHQAQAVAKDNFRSKSLPLPVERDFFLQPDFCGFHRGIKINSILDKLLKSVREKNSWKHEANIFLNQATENNALKRSIESWLDCWKPSC